MTGLRGEAAIIGIAELPAERRPSGPTRFTLDQYALLAKMVTEDAGVDPSRINGLLTHGVAESAMFAPATLCEYLGLALDFAERVDLGGATSAGMVWRAPLAITSAALACAFGAASAMIRMTAAAVAAAPRPRAELVWGVVEQLWVPAGRI